MKLNQLCTKKLYSQPCNETNQTVYENEQTNH